MNDDDDDDRPVRCSPVTGGLVHGNGTVCDFDDSTDPRSIFAGGLRRSSVLFTAGHFKVVRLDRLG